MQAGHSVLVTGFTARLPVRPGSTRRPSPATVAARGPSPPAGRPACLPGEARDRPAWHCRPPRHPTPRAARPRGEPSCRTSVQFRGLIDLDRGPQEVKSTPARRASA